MIEIPVPIVLASSSPTRSQLLSRLVAEFEVVVPRVKEEGVEAGGPGPLVLKLAEAKAREVCRRRPEALVIGADTVVVCRGEIIGKPVDRRDAVGMLGKLTRGAHSVVSGLFVVAPDGRERSACVEVGVRMRRMSQREIEEYVERPGVLHKAGVYSLQEDDPNVEELAGSASAVMGLPLERLSTILLELYPGATAKA